MPRSGTCEASDTPPMAQGTVSSAVAPMRKARKRQLKKGSQSRATAVTDCVNIRNRARKVKIYPATRNGICLIFTPRIKSRRANTNHNCAIVKKAAICQDSSDGISQKSNHW